MLLLAKEQITHRPLCHNGIRLEAMPTKLRRENILVERFLSGYESLSWADAQVRWLDEESDGAVEALATRPDGQTLAIEHTIIEPFISDKEDFAFFKDVFLPIESDVTLRVPGYWIQVFIPVGTLHGQRKRESRNAIAEGLRRWLIENRLVLPEGFSKHSTHFEIPDTNHFEMDIYARVTAVHGAGALNVRRQQMEDNLSEVVLKAINNKLPKLIQTEAKKHILILERQHMNLYASRIIEELESQRANFPRLELVDEVWILETMFYEREQYLRFELFRNGKIVSSMDFMGEKLLDIVENGIYKLVNRLEIDDPG